MNTYIYENLLLWRVGTQHSFYTHAWTRAPLVGLMDHGCPRTLAESLAFGWRRSQLQKCMFHWNGVRVNWRATGMGTAGGGSSSFKRDHPSRLNTRIHANNTSAFERPFTLSAGGHSGGRTKTASYC
ncbi:hypothetical protein M404DRAFT_508793 [Pisolithus tinctorius Marx 270]|uniref:Uncharacterized protein n=1 Tax=Pisolithus tinctorius Marx 270 TaxID=870435 RepID=A0A0C3PD01_PISTI|nr:hypothetical protein M404DRAFT_508793 [Pisolithus tinctorius Marx 270]